MTTELIHPDTNPAIAFVARGREALVRLAPQMAALEAGQLSPMNVDITLAVSRALGVAPAIGALRARIATDCAAADQTAIDELEDRAFAAACANMDYETTIAPPQGIEPVLQEAFDARGVLLPAAKLLIACNLLKEEQIAGLKGGHGYRDVADDLLTLSGLFATNWSRIEGQVPIRRAQLDRLQGLGEKLLQMLGIREMTPERIAATADIRARAFTLLDNAYSEARRAVTTLRWNEGDADAIAPPLRSRPVVRRPEEKPATNATQPTTTTTTSTTTTTPVPTTPAAPSPFPRSNPFGNA